MLLSKPTSGPTLPSSHLYDSADGPGFETEERLKKVQPHFNHPNRPLSPPTKDTFEFPSLLECLSDLPKDAAMPPQDFTLHEDSFDDIQYSIKHDSSRLLPDLAQQSLESRANQPFSAETYEIEEIGSEVDLQRERSASADSYSLNDLILEAKDHFGNEKPDFCITTPDHTTRQVELTGAGMIATIYFQSWSSGLGYWSLTDNTSDEYIVKCVGNTYYVWEGVRRGFSTEPVAKRLRASRGLNTSRAKLGKDNAKMSSTPSSGLRERTTRQFMPYTMYNMQKKYDAKGLRLSETELENIIDGGFDHSFEEKRMSKKRKQSNASTVDSSTERSSLVLPRLSSVSEATMMSSEDVLANTTLRTRFSGFDRATIPIVAQKCPSHEEFFATIQKKWAFKLDKQKLQYCVATFPWLGSDKNILLQQNDTEGFCSVIEEVKRAPGWQESRKVEVVIEIFAE